MSWIRRIGFGVGVVAVVLVAGVGTVYAVSSSRMGKRFDEVKGHKVTVPTDSASIERGRHLATAVGKCGDCHDNNLAGKVVIDDPAVGTVTGANLTAGQGGVIGKYDDVLLERAIRHGVGHDGRGLLVMPSYEMQYLADEDLGAMIAWIRSVKPVDHVIPPQRIGPVGRALFLAGKLPLVDATRIVPGFAHPVAVPVAATIEYGKYAIRTGGCQGCHGEKLSGGPIPGGDPSWPPASNITPTGLAAYSEGAFTTLLRTGKRPAGTMVSEVMPYRYTKDLTDVEIKALWLYLQTVSPREYAAP